MCFNTCWLCTAQLRCLTKDTTSFRCICGVIDTLCLIHMWCDWQTMHTLKDWHIQTNCYDSGNETEKFNDDTGEIENENEDSNEISAWNALKVSASPHCMLQSNARLLSLHGIIFNTNGMLQIHHVTQQLCDKMGCALSVSTSAFPRLSTCHMLALS